MPSPRDMGALSDAKLSAHDVARELRHRLGGIGSAKLHKLLYYCQGWHCAWTGQPLFREEIEAWGMGPVVADLWRDEKYHRPAPRPRDLDDASLGIVEYVVASYGQLTGKQLIAKTHGEEPWKGVYTEWYNAELTPAALAQFFGQHGPRAQTLRWFDRYLEDPANHVEVEPARKWTTPDSMADLRRHRKALTAG